MHNFVSVFEVYLFDEWCNSAFVVSPHQERPFQFLGLFIEVCFVCVGPEKSIRFTKGDALGDTFGMEGRTVDIGSFVCRFRVCFCLEFVLFGSLFLCIWLCLGSELLPGSILL